MKICYHGTKKENVKSILETGFNIGTWFAQHLEDAIEFGGEYVFWVRLEGDVPDDWQVWTSIHIPTNCIVSLKKYKVKEIKI